MEARRLLDAALADQVVALAGSTFQNLLSDSQRQSTEVVKALEPLIDRATGAWTKAAQTAANHIALVMQANPSKSVEQILKMPDVRQVLRTPFTDASSVTRKAINEAWDVGEAKGVKFANRDLKAIGADPVGDVSIDGGVRSRLLNDAQANGLEARNRLIDAIESKNPSKVREALLSVGRNHANRARYGVEHAGKHAASEAKEEALDKAAREQKLAIHKVWVTSFSATTCTTCARLHGTKRGLGEGFPVDGLKVYGTSLGHPPRHPNCRCRIVLYLSRFEDEKGPNLKTMRGVVSKFLRGLVVLSEQKGLELVRLATGEIRVRPYARFREGKFELVDGYTRVGEVADVMPLHRTSPGHVRLADLPEAERAKVLAWAEQYNVDLDGVTEDIFASFDDEEAVRQGEVWYQEEFKANAERIAETYDIPVDKAAAIIAITSAQKRWSTKDGRYPNLEQAEKFIQAWRDGKFEGETTQELVQAAGLGWFSGKSFGLNVVMLLKDELTVDEAITGAKRRSFFDNGMYPSRSTAVTNDTWMGKFVVSRSTIELEDMKAALARKAPVYLKKIGLNVTPAYLLLTEAVIRAHERAIAEGRVPKTWLPHQTQATAWMSMSRRTSEPVQP